MAGKYERYSGGQIMATAEEILIFTLGNERYALDITPVREIVDMTPITVIPRTPEHITGVINLRGEIVNILNLNTFLKLPNKPISASQKIIVFMAEAAKGNNVGVIVDNVSSVTEISASQVNSMTERIAGNESKYIKGIITTGADGGEKEERGLIIWLDIQKMFKDIENT
jgi:purine-binding chemotaxis protein CheW